MHACHIVVSGLVLCVEQLLVGHVQAALCESDLLVTVSPKYAAEICLDEGMGCGMRDLLAQRGVR